MKDLESTKPKVRKKSPSKEDFREISSAHVPKNKYNRKKEKRNWKRDLTDGYT